MAGTVAHAISGPETSWATLAHAVPVPGRWWATLAHRVRGPGRWWAALAHDLRGPARWWAALAMMFEGLEDGNEFYFVHSYHVQCNEPDDILAETIYDYSFTSAFQKANIFGVQFHPEKSHDAGEMLLRNFVNF